MKGRIFIALTAVIFLMSIFGCGGKGFEKLTEGKKDSTPPELTGVALTSNNSNSSTLVLIGDTITLTITADEPLSGPPTVTIMGQSATVTGSGTDWTAIYVYTGTEPSYGASGTVDFTIDYVDSAGNPGEQVTTTIPAGPGLNFERGPEVTFTISDITINPEIDATAEFGVTLSVPGGSSYDVIVNFTYSGTADGSDYTGVSSLTLNPGETMKSISIPVYDDIIDEDDETIIIDISSIYNGLENGAQQGTVNIIDNDTSEISINDITTDPETDTVAEFTVSLSNVNSRAVTVDYTTNNSSATAGSDYTSASGTLTFLPGEILQTISVSILGDTTSEGDETYTVTLSNPGNANILSGTGTGTIVDNDQTLSITDSSTSENLSPAVFNVSLSDVSSKTITVEYATSNITATAGDDYVAIGTTVLTFNPGETLKTINVTITNDSDNETNETFNVLLSNAANASILDGSGLGTIIDDDSVQISIGDRTLTEDNTNADFSVTLSGTSINTITVDYSTNNGSAVSGADYTGASNTLTFNPGETMKTISIAIAEDTLDEDNETFTVVLSNPSNANINDGTGLGTINDDDALPAISINDVITNPEESEAALFTVTLTPASGRTVTVDYNTSNITAVSGADYTGILTTGLTFSPGETMKTISVTILEDSLNEDTETYTVNLLNNSNSTISDGTGLGTIVDDGDSVPTISINDVTTDPENSVNADFSVTLNIASGKTVTLDYATSNGSAKSGTDYTAISSTTLSFSPGETLKTISVAIIGDTLDEDNETYYVNLSNPGNASISDNKGAGAIVDNDNPPTISINDVTTNPENAATAQFTVTLSAASSKTITVDYATASGTALYNVDFTGISTTTLTFNPGETSKNIDITILDDLLNEDTETYTVNLSGASNASISDGTGLGTIFDDGDAVPVISISDVTTNPEAGVPADFAVTMNTASGKTVTVDYATANGTASAPGDYTAISTTTLSFSPGQTLKTISVTIVGDSDEESDETYSVNLTNPGNASISDNKGAGAIIDDDRNGPQIVSAQYHDLDKDGKLDHIMLTFDENIDDSTFEGYVDTGTLGTVTTVWEVAGHGNVRIDPTAVHPVDGADIDNDNKIWLSFSELSGNNYDTDAKPDVTATDSDLVDYDSAGCYMGTDNANCYSKGAPDDGNADLLTTDLTNPMRLDRAKPVIISVSGMTGSDIISINFSEPVDGDANSDCNTGNIVIGDFTYIEDGVNDGAYDVLNTTGTDINGCDDNKVSIRLNANLDTVDLNLDKLAAAASSIYDIENNTADDSQEIFIEGAISPYVVSVSATAARKIRITFSESVVASTASTLTSYTLTEDPSETGCAGSGSDTVGLTGTVTQISSSVYEISTDADQCSTTTYKLEASTAIHDIDDDVALVSPTFGTFLGNERLKIASASCLSLTTMVVVFNKAVKSGTVALEGAEGTNQTETEHKYKFDPSIGNLLSAVRGSSPNDNQVTITHSNNQSGTYYNVLGANNYDGDDFNDAGYDIQIDGGTESLQDAPNDRAPWIGCGETIEYFDQGPISTNPFADGSNFGFLAVYESKLYIGPNANGNTATKMQPNGESIQNVSFSFEKDSDHYNTATTRDGGTTVPPYVTIGHSGCISNTADLSTGCGPDNEDGRGVFTSGTLNGTEYIFIGGARSAQEFDYLYYTSDTDNTLNFKYIDMQNITGAVTQGLSSLVIYNDRVIPGMAKTIYYGSGEYRGNVPDFGKINFASGSSEGDCTPGNNCNADDGSNGLRFRIDWMPYFGGATSGDSGAENTGVNWAWYVGVDSIFVFNDRIYAANGGHPQVDHNGSIIRSINNNPGACTGNNACTDWVEIAPRSDSNWYNSPTNNRFSLELSKISDMIPSDKAFSQFAEFNGNLYVTRTTCKVSAYGSDFDSAAHTETGCTNGSYSNREPQLWKCDPTSGASNDNYCDSDEWTLIDGGGSYTTNGITNFNDTGNHSMTIIVSNGSRMYIGFDNINGIEIWRTKSGVTNPTNEDDFELLGLSGNENGLGDPTNMLEIYSGVSINDGADYYIYISAGKNSTPVAIYRNKNN